MDFYLKYGDHLLSYLPPETLMEILFNLTYDKIKSIQKLTIFNNIISSPRFWRGKFIHDYGFNPPFNITDLEQAYLDENTVFSFGDNSFGQLGLGDAQKRLVPTRMESVPNIKTRYGISVACGSYHSILIAEDSGVYSFGDNSFGQLGLGDTQNRLVPTRIPNIKAKYVACGYYHTILIKTI